MGLNRPTPSLSGREDWEWNRLQAEQRDTAASPHRIHVESETSDREIEELQSELERKDRRLQRVIERYEHLLAEKNRELREQQSSSTLRNVRDVVRRFQHK